MKDIKLLSLTDELESDPFYLTKRLIEAGFYELYKFIIKVSKIIPGVTSEITLDKFEHYHELFSEYVLDVLPLYDTLNTRLITDDSYVSVQAIFPVDEKNNAVGFSILDKALNDDFQKIFDVEIESHEDDESISFIDFMTEYKSIIISNWEFNTILALYESTKDPVFCNMEKHGLLHTIIYVVYGASRIIIALQRICDYINNDITLTVEGNPMSMHMLMSKYALFTTSWNNIVNNLCQIGYDDESGITIITFISDHYSLDEDGIFHPKRCRLKMDFND